MIDQTLFHKSMQIIQVDVLRIFLPQLINKNDKVHRNGIGIGMSKHIGISMNF